MIAAAGESSRMRGTDKLLVHVAGRPLLDHCVEVFQRSPSVDSIVLVLRETLVDTWREGIAVKGWRKVKEVVPGGARRQDSVLAGLRALGECEWVMVHDGARPCITEEIIRKGLDAVLETGGAVAAVPVKDTIKTVGEAGIVHETPPRDALWAVQTPQVFQYEILLRSYQAAVGDATDDAMVVEAAGHKVKVFMGSYRNIKVTTPEDIAIVEIFLAPKVKD